MRSNEDHQRNGRTLSYYLRHSTLNCLHYIVDRRLTLLERFLWFAVVVYSLITTAVIIYYLQDELMDNPTITSLDRRDYPVKHINFPGVALCNMNMISKKRANKIADTIANATSHPKPLVLDYLRLLGAFQDATIDKSQFDMVTAQKILESYYDEPLRKFAPYLLLSELQLPCNEWMTQCKWRNKIRNCSELFRLRVTYSGFCCTFNYVRDLDKRIFRNMSSPDSIPLKVQDTGLDYGLSVTVNNDLDDYYIISSTRLAGVKVIAFNPEDYPDVTSGGVVELYCSMGYEGLFNIQPYTIYTTDAVKSYPVNKRKCYFEDEIETIYGKYSYSNCLVQCRLRSMMSLCGCAPIYILAPIEYPVCSFQDLNCLDKYKVKWNTVYPINVDAPELAHEREESLVCENCYYGCTDTVYKIGTNFSPLDGTNETIVRIFFANNYAYLYKQDAKFYWFEVLSVLGGLISIMIGCSFVTLAESLMFFCGRIYHAIITNLPRTRQHNH